MMGRTLSISALVALGLACGSSSSGNDGGSNAGSCPALTNLCARIPTTEVESACGTGYTKITPVDTSGAGPVNSCTYQKNVSTPTEYGVSIVYRCLVGADAHQYFQSIVSQTPNGQAVTGVGDEAYFHTDAAPFQQATLDVRAGQRVVRATVGFPDPAPCTPAQAQSHLVTLANKVFALPP